MDTINIVTFIAIFLFARLGMRLLFMVIYSDELPLDKGVSPPAEK